MKSRTCAFLATALIGALLLMPKTSDSQSIKSFDKVEIQTLYLNTKDSVVRFQVLNESKSAKYLPELTYYWYKSNTILKTVGGADGKLLNGEYVCFFQDNNLKEKGKFLKGIKDGLWISWYSNGKINERINWKKGILHGEHISFAADGSVAFSKRYKNGVLQVKREKKKTTTKTTVHPEKKLSSKGSKTPSPQEAVKRKDDPKKSATEKK